MQITKENLTIIIVTIKSQNIIDDCLKSIDPDIKKIIVENSSDQEFIDSLKKKYKNIECYLTGKNLGMGPGNNVGIKKSKTRYVMILNPDTILKSNTLSQIFEISKNLEFAILSPLSDNKDYPNYKIHKELRNETNNRALFEFADFKWQVKKRDSLQIAIQEILALPDTLYSEKQKKGLEYVKKYFSPVTKENLDTFLYN